ncbi:hypothetical protein MUY27_20175 [Mucilaginibacter sp. RS28]|uniref:Fimbrial assembly protein (PilN) n=1 Tax=Mucilaginibacter straminoryzae TaxID=2932774 RepID=A0A9X1X7S5_9SPHI|nr:hypothetical protein [Mucilaginibacter straminoryzae]MCJ8212045.1 hypothetical protein [Mucilaginibacter straminoryzae]
MLSKYYRFQKVAGISIEVHRDGNVLYHVCCISLKGDQLSIDKHTVGLDQANELKKMVPPNVPVAVNIYGKGVLIKQLKADQTDFTQVLPNAQPDDFYIQEFNSGEAKYAALIRRTEADRWISQLLGLGLQPLQLSLGLFPVAHILDQLQVKEHLSLSGYELELNGSGEWSGIKYEALTNSRKLKLDQEQVDERAVIPYAAAFQLALSTLVSPVAALVPMLEVARDGALAKVKWRTIGVVFLCGLFVVLLVNFITLTFLESANTRLATQIGQTTKDAEQSEALADSIAAKKALLDSLGWEENQRKAKRIDEIGELLPREVKWDKLSIDPITPHSTGTGRQLKFESKVITISGTSEKLIPVNEWIERLRTKAWIRRVQLKNFSYDQEANTGRFAIQIDYQ